MRSGLPKHIPLSAHISGHLPLGKRLPIWLLPFIPCKLASLWKKGMYNRLKRCGNPVKEEWLSGSQTGQTHRENEGGMQMPTYVSLFRGINVGGHHKVRMEELKALHEGLGFKEVVTYIQSGNVVFTSDDGDVARLPRQIEDGFAQKFGFQVKVMVRTAAELEKIVANNPFQIQPTKELKWVLVLFLETRLERMALEEFQKIYDGPEELYLIDQEIYIYYPDGMGQSKLPSTLLEKKLKTGGTGRNWNTILQLQKLSQR
jgi:uncharacterized protein (DUF1697 family)